MGHIFSSLANNPELWDENSIAIESPIQAVNLNRGGGSGGSRHRQDTLYWGLKSGRSKNKLEYAESHSDAGALFFNFLEFVKAPNPAVVLIENVPEYQRTASMEGDPVCALFAWLFRYRSGYRVATSSVSLNVESVFASLRFLTGLMGFDLLNRFSLSVPKKKAASTTSWSR